MAKQLKEPKKPKADALPTDAECMKLALWFIDKCGGVSRASSAFRCAAAGLCAMQKPEIIPREINKLGS